MATVNDLPTPTMLIDIAVMERNIASVAAFAREIGRDLRPHAKTHKCLAIARRQIAAGAVGLTVSCPWEAEVLAEATDSVFVARPCVRETNVARLTSLALRGVRVIVGVDSYEGASNLETAAAAAGLTTEVRIEVDSGQGRCGVRPEDARDLARRIAQLDHLQLEGIFSHEGHVYTLEGPGGVESVAARVGVVMNQVASELRDDGHDIRAVSVGSTPSIYFTPTMGGVTEFRPGTYVFNDQTQMLLGSATEEQCAASVLTTVISLPEPGQVVTDAGTKAVAADGMGRQSLGAVVGLPLVHFTRASEEHGILQWPAHLPQPRVGDLLRIIPYHICPAINLYRELVFVEGDRVVDIQPVDAQGHGPALRQGAA